MKRSMLLINSYYKNKGELKGEEKGKKDGKQSIYRVSS